MMTGTGQCGLWFIVSFECLVFSWELTVDSLGRKRSVRLQNVKLTFAGIYRVGQGDGKIICAACGDGIGPNRHPLAQGQSEVRAAQQMKVAAESAGGVE